MQSNYAKLTARANGGQHINVLKPQELVGYLDYIDWAGHAVSQPTWNMHSFELSKSDLHKSHVLLR